MPGTSGERARIANDGARFGLGQHRRAQKRATGDDFGTTSFNILSALEPNIVSGGTPRKAAGKKGALKREVRAGSARFRQDYCLHTTISYAIVPLPLPMGGGVFFAI